MAKPGDVVEFRSGLFGLEPPQNLGLYVARWRKKGVPWVRIITVDGPKELKAEHLSRKAFRDRFTGDLKDVEAARARLRDLLAVHGQGALQEEAEDDLAALEEALWQATCDTGGPLTEAAIAAAYFGPDPSPQQLRDTRAALERCRRPGTGRFEAQAKGDEWRPWTPDEVQAMRDAWQSLQGLRRSMVRREETEDGTAFVPVGIDEAGLTDQDQETLGWVKAAMVQWIEHDGVPDHGELAGIGGTGAVAAFGMDLHRILGFLAADWIRSAPTNRSSDYVHFLLETGLWTPDDAVQGLMRRHVNQEPFFEHIPDEAAEAAAVELPEPDQEPLGDREDLCHLECYTIDPPDAKDFDDAVGMEDLGEGRTRLWVHIADVSHYVRPGTILDRHAKMRATSVYLPGHVLPMLPHRIADHLCSLRDDGDRNALSVAMEVDADGHVVEATFHKSRIRVTKNLAYGDALQRAEAGQEPFAALLALAQRMRTHRKGLDLETGELKVLLEESGFSALEKRADPATRMIETFMVAANVAVARHLDEEGVPLLFRCHPLPDPVKAERFQHQMETMGLPIVMDLPGGTDDGGAGGQTLLDQLKAGGGKLELFGGGLTSADTPDQDEADDADEDTGPPAIPGFAQLDMGEQEAWLAPFRDAVDTISAADDTDLADVATLKLLACMGKAYYTPQNEGHFGLASTQYCHFTSPIRRYPDLVVHRNLKWLLAGKDGEEPHPAAALDTLCDHCSDQEQAAADLERRVRDAALVLASLQSEDGRGGRARITGVTPASCFVRLDNGVEARVPVRELPGGPYQVDEWESMLFLSPAEASQRFDPEDLKTLFEWMDEDLGEARRVRARLGDRVTVRLAGRDVAQGRTGARIEGWA